MRISILSDLHLEFGGFEPVETSADVTVLAGDIWTRDRGVTWAAKHFRPERTICLAGNHEFYMESLEDVLEACDDVAARAGVHFLENRSVVIDGVRFVGSTLWTDFSLDGADLQPAAMDVAQRSISDFQLIFRAGEAGKLRTFEPRDATELHREARKFLQNELASDFSGPTVVVSHFLPHRRSIAPKYEKSLLNPYFCNDLSDLIDKAQPALWIHGHAHESCDYRVGTTRVVSNPRGYAPDEINPAFDPGLVIDI